MRSSLHHCSCYHMAWRWFGRKESSGFLCGCKEGFNYQQQFSLVNIKLKWVKDTVLDSVIAGEREIKAASILVSLVALKNPSCFHPIYHLSRYRKQLGIPQDLKLATFIRRFPSIFQESYLVDSGGTRVPSFSLTPEALILHQEELDFIHRNQNDLIDRLCKLLMLTRERILPLQTIDQLKWDMGLPHDYHHSLIPKFPELFSLISMSDDRAGLKLLAWDDRLAISHLQSNSSSIEKGGVFEFPIGFTPGFGLKRKCLEWLSEWQTLPYTSPYLDPSHLDPRTDESEKRIVGVFHELLHLTIQKKTERKNVSNLRKPLALPQKFTKVFERHPGIFYISKKCDTQTVVLREAYDGNQLIQKHRLGEIREKFGALMKQGLLDKSRGLYKKSVGTGLDEDPQLEED